MLKFKLVKLLLCPFLLALLTSCPTATDEGNLFNANSKKAADFDARFINEWFELVYHYVAYERVKPPLASRIYAYLGVGIYESVICGMPEYVTLEGQLKELKDLPRPDKNLEYDWPTVLSSTLYLVSDELISQFLMSVTDDFKNLRDRQFNERKEHVDGEVFKRSKDYGNQLSEALLAWIQVDNFDETRYNSFYQLPDRAGHPERWEPTSSIQEACEPYWSTLRTFVMDDAKSCQPKMSVDFSTDTVSEFFKQVEEVLWFDRNMTEDQRQISLFWADDPGETATPPGHWTNIMNQISRKENLTLDKAAEMYVWVGIGIAESFLSTWYTKYDVNLVRPKTYIQEFLDLPYWEPLVETPPFPEYTSAHSSVSMCAAELLTDLYGENYKFTDSTHLKIGLAPRSFNNFKQAAVEAGMSRLYGGIHYRFSIDDGLEQGTCLSEIIKERVVLRAKTN